MKSNKTAIILLAATLFMFSTWWAFADAPPKTMSYQGFLTDSSGVPINNSVNINAKIYTVSSGGAEIYEEDHNSVTVNEGQFEIILGSKTPNTGNWSTLDFSQALYLEITANGETLSPRIPLSIVAYARFAYTIADGSVTPLKLNGISGSGDSGQAITSDGAGGFNWSTISGGGGDITGVTAGTGLSGGGTSGDVSVSADTTYLQRRVSSTCAAGSSIRAIAADGTVTCETDDTGGGLATPLQPTGTAATVSNCQYGSIVGNGTAGIVSFSADQTTGGCTINLGATFTNGPVCTFTTVSNGIPYVGKVYGSVVSIISKTSNSITFRSLTTSFELGTFYQAEQVHYICMGY